MKALVALPVIAALIVAVRKLAPRSNTQIHRINR